MPQAWLVARHPPAPRNSAGTAAVPGACGANIAQLLHSVLMKSWKAAGRVCRSNCSAHAVSPAIAQAPLQGRTPIARRAPSSAAMRWQTEASGPLLHTLASIGCESAHRARCRPCWACWSWTLSVTRQADRNRSWCICFSAPYCRSDCLSDSYYFVTQADHRAAGALMSGGGWGHGSNFSFQQTNTGELRGARPRPTSLGGLSALPPRATAGRAPRQRGTLSAWPEASSSSSQQQSQRRDRSSDTDTAWSKHRNQILQDSIDSLPAEATAFAAERSETGARLLEKIVR